jgi:PAS domain S-box-containing protein
MTARQQAAAGREVKNLLKAFKHFEDNSRRLESAYRKMQAEFKRVNVELDAKNTLLSQILHHLTNAVVTVSPRGDITSFNRGAEKISGVPAARAVGRPYAEVLGRGLADNESPLYTLRTGRHVTESEKTVRNASGEPVPVSFSTSILEDSEGNLLGALEVLRDLSEVKRMQEEVQRSKTLAALGEMAAAVAHEIRNPLGAMGGYATLLERDLENDGPRLALVRQLIKTLSSLNKIVGNLMFYTRPLSLQRREIDFAEHVHQVLDFAAIGLEGDGVTFDRRFPRAPVRVRIDPEKNEQVILNLVQNAVRAMGGRGRVKVGIGQKAAPGGERMFLSGVRVGRVVYLSVQDTGCGIPDGDMRKLFNPFFTTREDGNGLGLSIVKKIVDLHGGEISVKSRTGQGTTFEVVFPG